MHNTYGLNESDYMALLQVFADDFATIVTTVSEKGQSLLSQLIIKQITEVDTPDQIKKMSDTLVSKYNVPEDELHSVTAVAKMMFTMELIADKG